MDILQPKKHRHAGLTIRNERSGGALLKTVRSRSMAFSFLKPAKLFVTLSTLLVLGSCVLFVYPGPKYSIEFTGGTMMELTLPEGKTKEDVSMALRTFEGDTNIGNPSISETDANHVLVRLREISNEENLSLMEHLKEAVGESIQQTSFTTIGPTVGSHLKTRSLWALLIACIMIVVYVALAFRKIPRKYSPWRFGIVTVVTLFHDIMITVGVFVILSYHTTFELDTLFITALLTILGYSVNDTIIIFDRIRDNLIAGGRNEEFAPLADKSLRQTVKRSLNTSISTLIMLTSLYFLGGESIQWFVLALIVGIGVGSYSSIFLATPLLVWWHVYGGERK